MLIVKIPYIKNESTIIQQSTQNYNIPITNNWTILLSNTKKQTILSHHKKELSPVESASYVSHQHQFNANLKDYLF